MTTKEVYVKLGELIRECSQASGCTLNFYRILSGRKTDGLSRAIRVGERLHDGVSDGDIMSDDRPDQSMDFLLGGGEMGRVIRSMDWSQTPLGRIQSWPQSLRTAISILSRV